MAIEFTWSIPMTEYNTEGQGIFCCHWRCSGVDGDHTASSYGTTSHTPDPDASDFIAYADLTEADVLGWVHGAIDKDATEAAIAAQIDALINPTAASGTPWAA